jgi:hypothetical protein
MPIYVDRCEACGNEAEDIRSLSAPAPEHCGQPTVRVPQPAGMAYLSKNGVWFGHSMPGKKWVGAGRPKPKTIGKGHGLGGRRPNPSIRNQIGMADPKVRAEFEQAKAASKAAKERREAR